MAEHIFIRVSATAENYQNWEDTHNACEEARKEFGITDGPFYKDATDPNAALVHLVVEDMDRAMGWFKDARFAEANQKVTLEGPRELYFAKQR